MKSVKIALLFGALSLVFMGCPYESTYPVDSSSNAKVDKTLKGSWEERDEKDTKYIINTDGNMYTIEKRGTDTTNYVAFVSKVGDGEYVNLYEKSKYDDIDATHKYYIYRFTNQGDRLKLEGVTDNITEDFASSAELRDYIIKYQGISFFFDKDEAKTFYKDK